MHRIFICLVFPSWTLSMCVFKQCFWLLYYFYIIFCSYKIWSRSYWSQNLCQRYYICTAFYSKIVDFFICQGIFGFEIFCEIVYKAQIELSCPWVVYIYSWGVVNTCIFLSCWVSVKFSSYQSLSYQVLRICSSFYETESEARASLDWFCS